MTCDAAWEGGDIDVTKRLPSSLILGAAEADAAIAPAIGPYVQMAAGPSSLDGLEARAQGGLGIGLAPRLPAGPSRRELAELVERITSSK
jgi:hypothetical protein